MRFWDSSALVPLCLIETPSEAMHRLADEDDGIAIWWGSPVECATAFARRRREGSLSEVEYRRTLVVFGRLGAGWVSIDASGQLRDRAIRLAGVHPLRAGDVLQLAAGREGFSVLPADV